MKKLGFKWAVLTILTAVILPLFCVTLSPKEAAIASENFFITREADVIEMVGGDFSDVKISSENDILSYLNNFKEQFGFESSAQALSFNKKIESVAGYVYKFDQIHNGIKVYGSQLNVNVNLYGKIKSIIGKYHLNLEYDSTINYTEAEAFKKLTEEYQSSEIRFVESVIILTDNGGYVSYAYENVSNDGTYDVYVRANDLEVTKELLKTESLRDSIPTSGYTITNVATLQTNLKNQEVTLNIDKYVSTTTGEYFYLLADKERNIYVVDGKNRTDYAGYYYYDSTKENGEIEDQTAIQAYEYIMKCYDFYADKNSFGVSIEGVRNPNDEKIKLIGIVHYGNNYENAACYVPKSNSKTGYFVFGDGYSLNKTASFVNGLDVVGHEYQHSITDRTQYLEYENESGAISEAFSDIFGAVIEGYELTDPNFWRMGEDIYTNGNYFRDMSNPGITNCTYSYDNMFDLCEDGCTHSGNCDRGGVHYNCTLMTYATYIMYQQNPTFFTKQKILELWFQTLPNLSTNCTFIEFASVMMNSAKDLGYSEEEQRYIEVAFATVDIPGYTGVEIWNGNTLKTLTGYGTQAEPYLINSVDEFASFAYYVNNSDEDEKYLTASYRLTTDLDLGGANWVGIGTNQRQFNGSFNGGSNVINGLNITGQSGDTFGGLFKYVGADGYIYDLNIGSGKVETQAEYVGAIAGSLQGGIAGCSSDLDIKGENVGGLVGLVENYNGGRILTNSYTTSDLEGSIVGGLISVFATYKDTTNNLHHSAYISSSYTTGNLTGDIVGGLVGKGNGVYLLNNITISKITGQNTNSKLGGFIGEMCYANPMRTEIITEKVLNYIISCKSTAEFSCASGAKVGLAVGYINNLTTKTNIYIANNTLKERETIVLANNAEATNIKLVNNVISEDELYAGAFDFDNKKYYTNTKNWTVLAGNEAFDLVSTFEVTEDNKMPTFIEVDFWFNNFEMFAGGDGSESSPYEIQTPEQLAYLAKALSIPSYYSYYSNKHYKLTQDINMEGKVWVGIGVTLIKVEDGQVTQTPYPFRGNFDGDGHTIYNMSTISAYMINADNATGSNYTLTEFSASLFGVTSVTYVDGEYVNPVIKNLNLENVNSRGSNASAVVSQALYAVNVENVSVVGGNITSSGMAGGIVAKITGLYEEVDSYIPVSTISDCYTHLNISGVIAGGAVGYVTNATPYNASTLNIINFLNRGQISVSGLNIDSSYDAVKGNYNYYKPTAGSVIGVTLIKNLNIINSINIADIVAYNDNGYLGGFIGSVGVGDLYAQKTINIKVDGCKQAGKLYYIFDGQEISAGSVLGGVYQELGATINVEVTNKTYSIEGMEVIYKTATCVSLTSNIQTTEDQIGEGAFDIYNNDYYNNQTYFNTEYAWGDNIKVNFYIVVMFKVFSTETNSYEIFDIVTMKESGAVVPPTEIPTRTSTAKYQFVFKGWSDDLTNVDRNMTVYAEFDEIIRKYKVTYKDLQGNIIEVKEIEYGNPIHQLVLAPEKEGNFFIEYEFLRWGEEGQEVTGDVEVAAVYKITLTGTGSAIVFFLVIIIVAAVVAVAFKKKV